MVVLAGPNGAGKSTASPRLVRDALKITEFVNADVIAAGLSAFAADRAAVAAGRILLERVRDLAARGVDLALETTLASRGLAPWLAEVARAGAEVHVVFLALASPELALARVRARVALGGHDIPAEVVQRRHARGLENLRALYAPLATSWTLLDASDLPTLREHGGAGDPGAIEQACRLGVGDALARHRLHGVPAPVWRDGALVHLKAEELLCAPRLLALDDPVGR